MGGRWHIIPQLTVYATYIPLMYCLLGDYMLPTTYQGNQKQPLIQCSLSKPMDFFGFRIRNIFQPTEVNQKKGGRNDMGILNMVAWCLLWASKTQIKIPIWNTENDIISDISQPHHQPALLKMIWWFIYLSFHKWVRLFHPNMSWVEQNFTLLEKDWWLFLGPPCRTPQNLPQLFQLATFPPKRTVYLDPPRGAKWMVKGATKQPLRVQTPPLGGCW